MSEQYPGGWITKSPPAPSGPYNTSTAIGIWNLTQQSFYKAQGNWPTQGRTPPVYWITVFTPPSAYADTGIKYYIGAFDASGNFYTGIRVSPQAGPNLAGYCAVKINTNGSVVYSVLNSKSSFSPGADGLVLDSSNNLYISTLSDGSSAYTLNEKFDSSGNLTWAYIGNASNVYPQALDSRDGVTFYGGGTGPSSTGYWQKMNSSGTVTAAQQITDSDHTYFWIKQLFASNAGDSYASLTTIYEGAYVKFNSSGTIQVYSKLGNTGYNGQVVGFALDNKATPTYFYATGFSQAIGPSSNLYKVNASNGTSVSWSKLINSVNAYYGYIDVDSSGNIHYFGLDSTDNKKLVIIKFDSSGNVLWQRTLSYTASSISPFSITIDSTNSVFVLGIYVSSSPTSIAVVRLPIDGTQTGTYGNWTYASSSYTVSSGSGSWVSASYTQSAYSQTFSSFGGTLATKTFTTVRQDIA